MGNNSGNSSQIISLPKGGGALHGIGEKFSPDLHTGTGNFTVPIALPPGRNGFQPQLNLVYSTGNGNGLFGLGWSLSIPGVSRKTSHGIPRYRDGSQKPEDLDTFILSGAEDLLRVDGAPAGAQRYRPRTEGLFALIDHHTAVGDYWEVRSKDGLVSFYGKNPADYPNTSDPLLSETPIVHSPDNQKHIFAWKLSLTKDPFGNRIEYLYGSDEGQDGPHQWRQPLLRQIRYVDYGATAAPQFLISVTFEYDGDLDPDTDLRPAGESAVRPDPFSDYHAGFEIRTTRRCRAIAIRTHPELDTDPAERLQLVRRYEFRYQTDTFNGLSILTGIEVFGFNDKQTKISAKVAELPPLTFAYTKFEPQKRRFQPVTGADLPAPSFANPDLELVDLFGNGLPDIIEMKGTVRYWRNLGRGRFDLPRQMRNAPPYALSDPGVQIIDADGDGRADLLVTTAETAGYYPLDFTGQFSRTSYQRYKEAPSFNLKDPEVKLVDLTGDGITDVLRSGTSFECYFNDPKDGWLPGKTARIQRRRLEDFPDVNFSDPRVKWADMTGDGMQDIVLVYDGNVEYWPNLGYGKWGKRVHMENGPRFNDSGYTLGYDPRRILVGDIDGDGLADIVYVGNRKVTLWINRSGNAWGAPIEIQGTPPVTDMDAVRLVDLHGTGVSGLLWSSDAQGNGRPHMFFLNFTAGIKPYLLNEMDNNIGATTKVQYAPSTKFYLEDQKHPTARWKTPLPFPVQVVERVEVIDQLSKGKLTTRYVYHRGYWDGAEREFRGFGMVEQLDTEIFDDYNKPGLHGNGVDFITIKDAKQFSAPTLTKTWFHQGPIGEEFGNWEEQDWSREYWDGDPQLLDHTAKVNDFLRNYNDRGPGNVPSPRNRRVKRDALRSLRGSILRTELYALDGTDREKKPYMVTEHAYSLREEQHPSDPNSRIFFPHVIAQRTTQWERGDDPMTSFTFTGEYDDFGQPLSQTAIAMPRRSRKRLARRGSMVADETSILATHTRTKYATPLSSVDSYIRDRVARITSFTFLNKPSVTETQPDDVEVVLRDQVQRAKELHGKFETDLDHWQPEQDAPTGYQIFAHAVSYYDGVAYQGAAWGTVGPYGALTRSESLVFNDEILNQAYNDASVQRRPAYLDGTATLPAGAPPNFGSDHGYLDKRSNIPGYVPGYYIVSQQQKFDFQEGATNPRGLIRAQRDSLNHESKIDRYDDYQFLPLEVTDPKGMTIKAEYNLRVLQPNKVTDPNGNFSEVEFSPLGLVTATWVKGKNGEGDQSEPSSRTSYDFLAFKKDGKPIYVRAIRRVYHDTDPDDTGETIESREYSDGFGRSIQTRTQGEEVRFGDSRLGGGDSILPADQNSGAGGLLVGVENADPNNPNVIVSGWQVYDNKGKVVEKYEPFYSTGWDFEPEADSQHGEHVEMYYDPRGQVIRTVNPDGSEQRVIYGVPDTLDDPSVFKPTPWEAYTYDANDNAGRTRPTTSHIYAHQFNTPASIVIDALGRTVEAIQRNRAMTNGTLSAIEEYRTSSTYDIQGNLITLTDTLGRKAFHYAYDLAKRNLKTNSVDAGERWVIFNAAGVEIERRDSKGAITLRSYDELNRPKRLWAHNNGGAAGLTLREELTYGDDAIATLTDAEKLRVNLFGKLYEHKDESGKVTFAGPVENGQLAAYDFKGNPLEKIRQVIADSSIRTQIDAQTGLDKSFVVDWSTPPALDGAYQTSVAYDALNRTKWMRYPDDAAGNRLVLRPRYNRAGALEAVALFESLTAATGDVYVNFIAYNAKGQRVLIAYGNGLMTRYAYESETFRLARLRTEKNALPLPAPYTYRTNGGVLQDFGYQYDLAGNIISITDRAPGSGVVNNPDAQAAMNPNADPILKSILAGNPGLTTELASGNTLVRVFHYDAISRLISATGRESKNISNPRPWEDVAREGFNWGAPGTPSPENARNLTQTYTETYQYDPAGNMLRLKHSGGWSRYFGMAGFKPVDWKDNVTTFLAGGAVNWGVGGNRLTNFGNVDDQSVTHTFDNNGNMTREFTNRHFGWDHANRMIRFADQPTGADPTKEACYLYSADGIRVKKWVRTSGGDESTVYIDDLFEVHMWRKNGQTGKTSHLHVMDNQRRVAILRVGTKHPDDGGEKVQYHLGDHLGSSGVVVGGANAQANAFINREEFFPYGETSFGSYGRKRYRFTGKERDKESGLNYHGARYFSPWLSRWASCDPSGLTGMMNLFSYAVGNPTCYFDPSGLTEQLPQSTSSGLDISNIDRSRYRLLDDSYAELFQLVHPLDRAWQEAEASGFTEESSIKVMEQIEKQFIERGISLIMPGITHLEERMRGSEALSQMGELRNRFASAELKRGNYLSAAFNYVIGGMEKTFGQQFDPFAPPSIMPANLKTPAPFRASKVDILRPGSKEWNQAVKQMRAPGKGKEGTNFRVETLEDAQQLLLKGRPGIYENMEGRAVGYTEPRWRVGYDIHPSENVSGSKAPGNDLPHIKWVDWNGSDNEWYGHIFFDR